MRNRPLAARSLNAGIVKEQSLPTIMPNIRSPNDSRAPSQIENNNPNARIVSNVKKQTVNINNLFKDPSSRMSHTIKNPLNET